MTPTAALNWALTDVRDRAPWQESPDPADGDAWTDDDPHAFHTVTAATIRALRS